MKILPVFFLLAAHQLTQSTVAETMTSPATNIETTISRARVYAAQQEIDLSNKFIIKVVYERDIRHEFKRPYWSVLWSEKTISKGGDIELRLYTDGSIEESYYK